MHWYNRRLLHSNVCLFVCYQASEQAGASTITAKAVPSSFIYAQHCQYGEVHPGRWTKISTIYVGMLKNKGGYSKSTVFKLVVRICMNIKSNYMMCNCHSCSHLLTLSCLSVLIYSRPIEIPNLYKVTIWCVIVFHVVIYSHYRVFQCWYVAGPYRPIEIPNLYKVTMWCVIVIHVVIYSHYRVFQCWYVACPYRSIEIPKPRNGCVPNSGCTVTVSATIWDNLTYKVTLLHDPQCSGKYLYRP